MPFNDLPDLPFKPPVHIYGSDGWPTDYSEQEYVDMEHITQLPVPASEKPEYKAGYDHEISRMRVMGGWVYTTVVTARNRSNDITAISTTSVFVPEIYHARRVTMPSEHTESE